MDRMIYLAMTGAKHAMQQQQRTAHNLANANTTGFRADLTRLTSQPVYGPGRPSRVYSVAEGVGSDLSQGAMITTGRELDIAINGGGWIAVQAGDGTEAYTRRGDLRITTGGLLQTGSGELVLGNNGPVAVPPATKIEIGTDGTVSVVPIGQPESSLAVVDRIRLVSAPAGTLAKSADGLFRPRVGDGAVVADAEVTVTSGALEASNVNMVDSLVQLIDNARQFEAYVKLMETTKRNDETGQKLLRQG